MTNAQIFCILGLILGLQVVYADTPAVQVQKKLSAIHTLTASFSQTIHAKKRLVSRTSGTMALVRPNHFRWQTKQPMAQTVVADGAKVWIYDEALEQVTVSKQTKRLGVAGALFLSQADDAVARDFSVQYQRSGVLENFDMTAKSPQANFSRVRLIFKEELLIGIELDDQLGQHTVVRLTHTKMNQVLGDRLFHFTIPAGVDVVQQ